jgi:hypothetical protein
MVDVEGVQCRMMRMMIHTSSKGVRGQVMERIGG